MKLGVNPNCLLSEIQARIEPPPTPLAISEEVQERACKIVEANMRRNPVSAGSETYKFKMTTYENGSPEELLQFLTNSRKTTKGTGMEIVAERINFLSTLLCGQSIQ